MRIQATRLLPILSGVVAVIFIIVIVMPSGKDGEVTGDPQLSQVPQGPGADADSPAETLKTLSAQVSDIKNQMTVMKTDNDNLRSTNKNMTKQVMDLKNNIITEERKNKSEEHSITYLSEQLHKLTKKVDGSLSKSWSNKNTASTGDIPVGIGLDGQGYRENNGLVWLTPLDRTINKKGEILPHSVSDYQTQRGRYLQDVSFQNQPSTSSSKKKEDKPIPYYTVPRNATLIGATSMTALIGRIPVRGEVPDPFPFKVLIGADNLAANGVEIPDVFGMVASGTAVGDFNLSCVTGRINSITFVFNDGRIQTISSGSDDKEVLGSISDNVGIPCISGELKTDAVSFLTKRVLVQALETAAEAAAASETTSVVSELGSTTSSVTGDQGSYVIGRTVSGGAKEIKQWLDERARKSFDAIFVEPGRKIVLHIDKELKIDYDRNGRKTIYARRVDDHISKNLD